ncbi:MAG: class I SAM-dependent methyltransferase, partial [Leptospiraceae bacterium]|nr:class I SAM-dependent methyltransferase [Leptospiraceae bacterium]
MDKLLESGMLPDWLLRIGIRRLNRQRLREEDRGSVEANQAHLMSFIAELYSMPIAINTQDANEQHYELPPRFFELVLGRHLKYSCGYWDQQANTLDLSEERMLQMTMERADLQDHQSILELGCGWGSLTLAMARRFPQAHITAVSNSNPQRKFIQERLANEQLRNVEVITCDMNDLQLDQQFDRVVSVEMFEHMKNYPQLFQMIYALLRPGGRLFVHIFSHARFAYHYEVKDER